MSVLTIQAIPSVANSLAVSLSTTLAALPASVDSLSTLLQNVTRSSAAAKREKLQDQVLLFMSTHAVLTRS